MAIAFPGAPAHTATKQSTALVLSQPSIQTDLVADFSRRIAALVVARERAELEKKGAVERHLEDAIFVTADMAAATKATSPAGAMLQIMIALGDADNILSRVGEEYQGKCALQYNRLEKCLFSVMSVLVDMSGADPAAVLQDYYLGDNFKAYTEANQALDSSVEG